MRRVGLGSAVVAKTELPRSATAECETRVELLDARQ